ncbi:winged helix-turn-helix domain-containing protein [Trichocoleus sp. FACHB-591]|uniref:winged helix-turn-helix domain-containing protein n=1 Tax=Trichocoleus sp. FACHB-591 TaxID=2692872 RepID=UPI001684F1DE|nr:winged helix-turn-helix domain-containing protein [Trichocoleus sp. FACHB-591]MBD2094465.1 winged helix-turn-helix domain-containing protein [Trichocoleus sp. FACHB-591]
MERRTVAQAVIEVLQAAKQPMTVADITQTILNKDLYTFNTKEPRNIVRGAIERRCEGLTRKDLATQKCFKKLPDGRYTLVSDRETYSN